MIEEPLAVIVGPTAAGKSKIAVEVAAIIGGEIISGDSMQVYRGMDIGTAKISRKEMYSSEGIYIPHHMLDILDPEEPFSVAEFQTKVRPLVSRIVQGGKIPLLVGGTGLYIQSIIDEYNFRPGPTDFENRKRWYEAARARGPEYLHQLLAEVDPPAAAKLHPNDLKRVIRALEVYHITGDSILSFQKKETSGEKYRVAMVGLSVSREELYRRIDKRVDEMIAAGMVEEVQGLLAKGYGPHLQSLQSIGYKQIVAFLLGGCGLEEAIRLWKRDTRHFAKRQLTWFRRDQRICWFDVDECHSLPEIARGIAVYLGRTIQTGVE